MDMKSKVFIVCLLFLVFNSFFVFAQVKFRFSDGIYDQARKKSK